MEINLLRVKEAYKLILSKCQPSLQTFISLISAFQSIKTDIGKPIDQSIIADNHFFIATTVFRCRGFVTVPEKKVVVFPD